MVRIAILIVASIVVGIALATFLATRIARLIGWLRRHRHRRRR